MAANWNEWKGLQRSMELEGWVISDEMLHEVVSQYERTGIESLAHQIACEVKQTGRPLAEVAREVLAEFRERCGL